MTKRKFRRTGLDSKLGVHYSRDLTVTDSCVYQEPESSLVEFAKEHTQITAVVRGKPLEEGSDEVRGFVVKEHDFELEVPIQELDSSLSEAGYRYDLLQLSCSSYSSNLSGYIRSEPLLESIIWQRDAT